MKKTLSLVCTLALLSGALVALLAGPAAAAPVAVGFDCIASAPIVGDTALSQTVSIDVNSPSQVPPNVNFPVIASIAPIEIPSSLTAGGFTVTINNAKNISLKIPVPANATYQSASLSGGSGLGTGTPTIGLVGSDVILSIPGPIPGGSFVTPPTVTINLEATGALGSTIEPHVGGTSVSDPGFQLTVNAAIPIVGNSDVPVKCWPTLPNPALSVTTIANDTNAPTITIATPSDGASIPLGAGVNAAYTCADEPFGSGVATCVGPVANGSPIDTATLGPKSFSVTTTDNAGNSRTVVSNYTVIAPLGDTTPPAVTITSPPHGAAYRVGQVVNAAFSCSDASGITSCTGTTANGAAINTSTAGAKTYVVNALDTQGNPTRVTNSYYVVSGVATTLGPTDVGALTSSGSTNLEGAKAWVKVAAPAPNGGQLKVGDTLTIDWAVSKGTIGFPYIGNDGPDPINWSLPAPTNTTINGPVVTDENGLNGETRGTAHSGSGSTGLKTISPSANPTGATQLDLTWDDNSSPGTFDSGDGVIMHARFTATVTTPGTVTVQGFPGLSGYDPTTPGGDFSTTGVSAAAVGISYTVVDTIPATINVTAPVQAGLYAPGSSVPSAYSCADNLSTPTCVGTVANGVAFDTATSGPKQFTVTSVDATGNTTVKTITYFVVAPTANASNCAAVEANNCSFTVQLSNSSAKTITLNYATTPDSASLSDYTTASGVLTFTPGQLSKTVNVALTDDALDEPDETFTLSLSNGQNVYLGTNGTGTIQDGSATYTARYDAVTGAVLQNAALFYGIPFEDLTKAGGTFISFLTALSGGPAGPLAPPNNSGPVVITATYSQAGAFEVEALSALYGRTGDEMHWYGGYIIGFFYLLGGGT